MKVILEEGVLRYTINRILINIVFSVSLPEIQKSAHPPIYRKILRNAMYVNHTYVNILTLLIY